VDALVSSVSLLSYSPTILRASEDALEEDEPMDYIGTIEIFAMWWATKLAECFGDKETGEHPT